MLAQFHTFPHFLYFIHFLHSAKGYLSQSFKKICARMCGIVSFRQSRMANDLVLRKAISNVITYLISGVLHTKMWLVDKKHFYIGSANLDWRSLTQVLFFLELLRFRKYLQCRIKNCMVLSF